LQRMPPEAVADLTEWTSPEQGDRRQVVARTFASMLGNEWDLDAMIADSPNTPALRDDRPINEYYVLRRGSVKIWEPH